MSFSERVYEVVLRIPSGKVTTYADVAHALGCKAYRAVGVALAKNPHAPRVPCHRVIRSDRLLGGFMGSLGAPVNKKRSLLLSEGVVFDGEKVSSECVISLST